jgi:hypothetical protein
MVTTPNLAIEHIPDLPQKEVGFNDAMNMLDRSVTEELEIDCTAGGTIVVTAAQYRHFPLKLIGSPGAGFNLDLPDGDRYIVIWNDSGQIATVDTVSGGAAAVVVAVGARQKIIVDGVDAVIPAVAFELSNDTDPHLAGELDGLDQTISNVFLKDHHEITVDGVSSSGTLTLDVSLANIFEVALIEDVTTLTLSNPHATDLTCIMVKFTQAASPWALTYPASVKWAGGTAHIMSTGDGKIDVVAFLTVDGGTTWYGFLTGSDMS